MLFGDRKSVPPHEAHEMFWLTFELNVVPMAVWGFDGKLLNLNKAFLDLIGYTKEDFEKGAITWPALTPPIYHPLDENCIKQLSEDHIALPYEKEYLRKDGSKVTVRLHNATHDLGASRKGLVIAVPLS